MVCHENCLEDLRRLFADKLCQLTFFQRDTNNLFWTGEANGLGLNKA